MRVLIRGAGDIATGIALRLYRARIQVIMTDLPKPTAIRRTVCFSQAIVHGETEVEGVRAVYAADVPAAEEIAARGDIPVLADPDCACRAALRPDALVDAILAKRNLGTKITDAPIVVGIGPGFTAGEDCHAVVETMRGHTLGRVIYQGSALLNTNIPGLIGGYAGERVLRAPDDGIFHTVLDIGAQVKSGDVAGQVNGKPMVCTIDGVLRGLLADGTPVFKGMKSGDVDPRCREEYCYTASDKALAGTERGITEPTPTFSACFGQAFLELHPTKYAEELVKKMELSGAKAYLVNTGWNGTGKRISIKDTRGIIDAILSGAINEAPTKKIPYFDFEVPTALPGVDPAILDPRDTYADAAQWEEKAKDLAGRFIKNFAKYEGNEHGKALVSAGPQL